MAERKIEKRKQKESKSRLLQMQRESRYKSQHKSGQVHISEGEMQESCAQASCYKFLLLIFLNPSMASGESVFYYLLSHMEGLLT